MTKQKLNAQKQHVDLYRKVLLRKQLSETHPPSTIYVPFIGDGDIALQLYARCDIHGADNDPSRIETAKRRLPNADIIVADCNRWIEAFTAHGPFDSADFDAYSDPYESFRAFFAAAPKTHTLVLFFTDGHKQGIMRTGNMVTPAGEHIHLETVDERRKYYNGYFSEYVLPWFAEAISPYRIIKTMHYLRGMMLYWGAVISDDSGAVVPIAPRSRPAYKFDRSAKNAYLDGLRSGLTIGDAAVAAGVTRQTIYHQREKHPELREEERQAYRESLERVENALYQAAISGNVRACETILFAQTPDKWSDRRTPYIQNQFTPTIEVKENADIDDRIARYAEHFAAIRRRAAGNNPGDSAGK